MLQLCEDNSKIIKKADLSVGLEVQIISKVLTTAYVASGTVQSVAVRSIRKRPFVNVLVRNILSLSELLPTSGILPDQDGKTYGDLILPATIMVPLNDLRKTFDKPDVVPSDGNNDEPTDAFDSIRSIYEDWKIKLTALSHETFSEMTNPVERTSIEDEHSCGLQSEAFHSEYPLDHSEESNIDTTTFTRVLQDIWHVMHRLKLPVNHGARIGFSRAMRDAIFIMDQEDVRKVTHHLRKDGHNFEDFYASNPTWILARVRRHVPSPDRLVQRLGHVFCSFGPMRDATTGQPLFRKADYQISISILKHAAKGCFSDPPGIVKKI